LILATPVSATAKGCSTCCNPKPNKEAAMTEEKSLDSGIMSQFTGSECWYRHGLVPGITFTDGAKYVADQAGAYWLLDEIALAQKYEKKVAAEEFQVWKLTVNSDDSATAAARLEMKSNRLAKLEIGPLSAASNLVAVPL
jgi:hypothetical protein